MISNCPPRSLMIFIKTLSLKMQNSKAETSLTGRQRLLADKAKTFEEISPLTEKDVNVMKTNRISAVAFSTTPNSKKRKINETTEKEKTQSVPKNLSSFQLTAEQKNVLNAILSGQNVFFTGSAGTGKSYLLKRIVGVLPPDTTFATASTGVAACQIGGITLHSFAGIGSGKADIQQCIQQALRKDVVQQWRKCNHLIIDEISMIDGQFFQKLERIARIVRNNQKPFGGIQLILSGDFLQLPPVTKGSEKCTFCFQSEAWRNCINVSLELTQVMRQKDEKFIRILQDIRVGRCTEETTNILLQTADNIVENDGILATRLCTHKDDVEFINESKLKSLPGKSRLFKASDSDPMLSKYIDSHCPVGLQIELKEGSQIMLTKNMDLQKGLVNGARGVVIGFDQQREGLPIIKFLCGVKQTVAYERWLVKAPGGVHLIRRQLPLMLGWAMSIHKSQGMTLDCVEISLGRVFESGQAYVALSRARNLEGLRVIDFDKSHVRANPVVLAFYRQLRYASSALETFRL
ncbi:ATP-dependent DNA helicase PIF1-like isoform X2 [Centruroides sculpturatus]|nr:ATP-dependent DNA helicase PIF1-like isoform X2 [Centruroides sculpturatus]